ncbi:MAG: serine/threonine-protein kinase [Polyangiaceae bacterium]
MTNTSWEGRNLGGRWVLGAEIGRGGMGVVHVARHVVLGNRVAVKLLAETALNEPDAVRRFHREARAISSLEHPNIVALIDAGTDSDTPWYAMEFVEGTPLDLALLDGAFSEARLLPLVRQLAHALGTAHKAKLVHRDIKPANVMLSTRGLGESIKLLDFGISLVHSSNVSRITRTATTLGTPDYMAPEQAAGGAIDSRADVYSLGVTIFEMLSGRLPSPRNTRLRPCLHTREILSPISRRRHMYPVRWPSSWRP